MVSDKAGQSRLTPTAEMRRENPGLPPHVPGGHPLNPPRARAYLGSSMYRIHGTDALLTIGDAVSKGMHPPHNEDVLDLIAAFPWAARHGDVAAVPRLPPAGLQQQGARGGSKGDARKRACPGRAAGPVIAAYTIGVYWGFPRQDRRVAGQPLTPLRTPTSQGDIACSALALRSQHEVGGFGVQAPTGSTGAGASLCDRRDRVAGPATRCRQLSARSVSGRAFPPSVGRGGSDR